MQFCCNISIIIGYKWHHSRISLHINQTGTTQTASARNKGGNFIGQLCISVVPYSTATTLYMIDVYVWYILGINKSHIFLQNVDNRYVGHVHSSKGQRSDTVLQLPSWTNHSSLPYTIVDRSRLCGQTCCRNKRNGKIGVICMAVL